MNYNNLRYFVEIAREGNITRAAEKLFISQPTLSIHLKELEKEIGTPLFIRSRQRIKLTNAGELLFHWASPFFQQETDILKTIQTTISVPRKDLAIGIMGVDFIYELPYYVESFRKAYPDIQIKIKRMNWKPLLQALNADQIDISFQIVVDHIPNFCSSFTIATGSTSAAVPASSPLAAKDMIYAEDLKDYPFVIMDHKQEPYSYQEIMDFCRAADFEPNIIAEYSYIEPLLAMVNMGEAVTTTSELASLRRFDNIRNIPVYPNKKVFLSMLWKRNTENDSVILFLDFMKKQFGA